MKKIISNLTLMVFLALILALSAGLGGCGSDSPDGGNNSGQAAAPTFNPPPEALTWAPVKVTLTSQSPNVIIKYTTDGSDPKTSSTAKYTNPVTVDKSMTIKAYAYGNGFTASHVAEENYTRIVVTKALSFIYDSEGGDGDCEIYVYNSDGSGWESYQSKLTTFQMANPVDRISMTATGKLLFFSNETLPSQPAQAAPCYYFKNVDTGTVNSALGLQSSDSGAFISANGSIIVFYSTSRGAVNGAFYTINPDGSEFGEFAAAAGYDSPTISADGTKVVAYGNNDHDLYLFEKGETPFRITNSPMVNEVYHVISPDGSKVAYISKEDDNVYIKNTDGTGTPFKVTQLSGASELAWSSDGTKLVYIQGFSANCTNRAQHGIHIVNSDGTQDYLAKEMYLSQDFPDQFKSPTLR